MPSKHLYLHLKISTTVSVHLDVFSSFSFVLYSRTNSTETHKQPRSGNRSRKGPSVHYPTVVSGKSSHINATPYKGSRRIRWQEKNVRARGRGRVLYGTVLRQTETFFLSPAEPACLRSPQLGLLTTDAHTGGQVVFMSVD